MDETSAIAQRIALALKLLSLARALNRMSEEQRSSFFGEYVLTCSLAKGWDRMNVIQLKVLEHSFPVESDSFVPDMSPSLGSTVSLCLSLSRSI